LSTPDFLELLKKAWPELSSDQIVRVGLFYELVVAENEVQNLTRLISPRDFVEGHVLDVKELLDSGLVDFPAMDLGSGGGVPGLLAAIIRPDAWVLVDSEKKKAEFLTRAVKSLELSSVQVFDKRAEDVLREISVKSIVARAVGPVERIFGWIGKCSTWNSLVLMKGPGWPTEWTAFETSPHKKKLREGQSRFYEVGEEKKRRQIIKLHRPGK
jgi:16S rRNA (guanine(527)-N(7))-methyltransferase RsmG